MGPSRASRAVVVLGLLTACTVSPSPANLGIARIPVHERFDVAYTGRIDVELDEAEIADAAAAKSGAGVTVVEDDGTPQIRIDTKVLRMSPETFWHLFGFETVRGAVEQRVELSGGLVRSEDLDAAIDALVAGSDPIDLLNAPSIQVLAGHSASTWAVRQLSMVRGHSVQQAFGSFVCSPKVQVAEVGFGLDFTVAPTRADDAVGMDVTVRAIDLLGGPFEVQGSLAGSPGLTVQVPLVCRQTLRAELVLAPGESAFLGSLLVPDGSDVLVVFVSAHKLR
jgi:hypothetical protein